MKKAILIDGGFYRKRAAYLWGKKTALDRAKELRAYCRAHQGEDELYRIFYYDCPPIDKVVYHPLLKKNIDLKKSETFFWTCEFLDQLRSFRKFAIRLGNLSEAGIEYKLREGITKKICSGAKKICDLTEYDFGLSVEQKGVDMKIGIDIASMAYKKQVDQIVLIAGDSDFVPAAKLARREGIDFILDPMWSTIREDLYEHIDGLKSQWKRRE